LGRLPEKRQRLAAECAAIGRDPSELRTSIEAVLVLGRDATEVEAALAPAEKRYAGPGWGLHEGGFIGTPAVIVARIRAPASQALRDPRDQGAAVLRGARPRPSRRKARRRSGGRAVEPRGAPPARRARRHPVFLARCGGQGGARSVPRGEDPRAPRGPGRARAL